MGAKRLDRTTLIACTAIAAIALQGLDLHSTLSSGARQSEVNPLLQVLAGWIGAAAAVTLVKAVDIVIVLAGASLWRTAGPRYDKAFAACFSVVGVTYGATVASNYLGR